jgi:hypothetical protein
MPNFRVDISLEESQLRRLFAVLASNLMYINLEDFLADEVSPYLRRRIADRFIAEGDDVVGQWTPLAPTTERIRQSKGFPPAHPINARTHDMEDWLVMTPGDVKISSTEAVLTHPGPTNDGLMNDKMKAAQQGLTYPQTPPRPVIGVNQIDHDFIQSALVRYMFSGI